MTLGTPKYPRMLTFFWVVKIWVLLSENIHGALMGFHGCFSMFLLCSWCSYQEQKVCCFDPKVFGCLFKILLVKVGVHDWYFFQTIHVNFTIYTISITYNFPITFSNTQINSHTSSLLTKTSHPYNGGHFWGLLCNYIKFWYFCVFALWPESLRFYVKAQINKGQIVFLL